MEAFYMHALNGEVKTGWDWEDDHEISFIGNESSFLEVEQDEYGEWVEV